MSLVPTFKHDDSDSADEKHRMLKKMEEQERAKVRTIFIILLLLFVVGFLLVGSLGLFSKPLSIATAALLYSLAFFCLGGLLGFLFAIPRSNSNAIHDSPKQSGNFQHRTEVNTNLVQVSDWLTKIIVGVTLVQFHEIPKALNNFNAFAGAAFSLDFATGGTTAVASLLFFSGNGFLVGYLVTRLVLQGAFDDEDRSLYEDVKDVKNRLEQVEAASLEASQVFAASTDRLDHLEQSKPVSEEEVLERVRSEQRRLEAVDHTAFEIVQNYLFSAQAQDSKLGEKFLEVIKLTTGSAKEEIFQECRRERRAITQPAEKAISDDCQITLERAVDIFEVLQESDNNYREDYRVFAEIGFAYEGLGRILDKEMDVNRKAERALTEAIKLRDEGGRSNLYYEFYRAIVRIRLEGKSGSAKREDIEHDLLEASKAQRIAERFEKVKEIKGWLEKAPLPSVAPA